MEHFISLEDASAMTSTYRDNRERILDVNYQNQDILSFSETFDRDAIDTPLAQQDCSQLRIYYGMDDHLKVHAIVVGVDSNGDDMLPDNSNGFKIVEKSGKCPPECPSSSALNS